MTFNDGTEVTHSQMLEDGSVKVYIETPVEDGNTSMKTTDMMRKSWRTGKSSSRIMRIVLWDWRGVRVKKIRDFSYHI